MSPRFPAFAGAVALVFLAATGARADAASVVPQRALGIEALGNAPVSYAQYQGGGPGRRTLNGASVAPVGPRPVAGKARRGNAGAAIGAGIVGLAAGALIGSALSAQAAPPPVAYRPAYGPPVYARPGYEPDPYGRTVYEQPAYARPVYVQPAYARPVYAPPRPRGDAVAYCMQRYQSYDPRTGTYVGFDGMPRACP